jgi:Zn-dependent metalloprotease
MSALVMSAIGIQESAELFYNVMTKRLTENSQFADYRSALMEECKTQSSDTCTIVDEALKAVGI